MKKIKRTITEEVKLDTFYDKDNKQIVECEVTYYDGIAKEKIPDNFKFLDSKTVSKSKKKYEATLEKFIEIAKEITKWIF